MICALPCRRALLVFLALHASSALAEAHEVVTEPVTVVLFPQAVSDNDLVCLGQIAKLRDGSASLRTRIGKLDITEFKLGAAHVVVTQEQVRYRLLLAGIDASRFRLEGAKRTVIVESDEPVTHRAILAVAEQKVRENYAGDVSSVTITADKEMIVPLLVTQPGDRIRLEAKVKTSQIRAGQVRVDVMIVVNDKAREAVPVFFDISDPERAQGTGPRPGQVQHALATVAPSADGKEILIKSRDNVRIIANIGTTRIEATGEAMEDGYSGQIIRVRNLESNRVVRGRVETTGIVQADY